jgi:(E)-4-hydroxy-3-methylbut-2-enyl-diphosphate synthase
MTKWEYDGFACRRRPTRTVHVGDVAVGSRHPIRVQSMTTPSTRDTAATVEQARRLVEAGCEIVRVTVPTSRDAENLPNIRRELERLGIRVPLVADIHFTPAVALKAVEHVEKIRINPGNYADKKKFDVREYGDREYAEELERIERAFAPLVERAKELGVAMRIGTNHGSLSDRIMNRYGDTPEGMVESALEFVRICEARGYRELILSMKASNPVVVQQVYRLLAERMAAEGMDYPFHLGVTEAGDGEDGRIKSAIGIGALLDEGIGDTVRVSLTEDPVLEIPVARALVEPYNRRGAGSPSALRRPTPELRDPHVYVRRESREIGVGPLRLGGDSPVRVEVSLSAPLTDRDAVRLELDRQIGAGVPQETRAEVVSVPLAGPADVALLSSLRESMKLVAPGVAVSARFDLRGPVAAYLAARDEPSRLADRFELTLDAPFDGTTCETFETLLRHANDSASTILFAAGSANGTMEAAVDLALDAAATAASAAAKTAYDRLMMTVAPSPSYSPLHAIRLLVARLGAQGLAPPIALLDRPETRGVDPLLGASSALGGLLCDGIGDSIRVDGLPAPDARRLAFTILQGARVRITKTEFISCPSCGRTLFDLEETTARIKARTSHLKGVKIAVMGCVVNGPGEMADADFGYVGWGEDKIALFVGKEMVARDIPTAEADDRLVDLIKQHGRWTSPP